MKKKHNDIGIRGNKCPHCQEAFPSIIAVHQHILDDHQNIVAEEREIQTLEKMKKEQMKAEREKEREEKRKRRMEKRKMKIDYNDFRSQVMIRSESFKIMTYSGYELDSVLQRISSSKFLKILIYDVPC